VQYLDCSIAVWSARGDMAEPGDVVLDILAVSGGKTFERT
jgi:hypothetical protein